MARSATPAPTAASSVTVSTPNNTTNMPVQRNTPTPSTPGHRRISSIPKTPGTSPLTACSSSPGAFTAVRVHTAKCSECDKRNMDVMRRCPGCTFQVCKPCQERREKGGRSLAHGNMLSPHVATPGTGGRSVVRRRPVGRMESVERRREEKNEKAVGQEVEEKGKIEEMKGKKRAARPATNPKVKPKVREVTPAENSSDDDFVPDPASPTSNKRSCTGLTLPNPDPPRSVPWSSGGSLSSLPNSSENSQAPATIDVGYSLSAGRSLSEMTTDEILAHYDVNTSTNPYKAHLLSRQEPIVSNPVIQVPEVLKRGFKPRPSAEEIQKSIQDKVRKKLGLHVSDE